MKNKTVPCKNTSKGVIYTSWKLFSLKEQHFDGWISNLSPKEPLNSCDIRYLQFARWPYSMDYYRMEDSTLLWYYNSIINQREDVKMLWNFTLSMKNLQMEESLEFYCLMWIPILKDHYYQSIQNRVHGIRPRYTILKTLD